MTPAPDAQAAFVDALLDPDPPTPNGLRAWHGETPTRRFAVYRNNVIAGLIDALGERFPVCLRLVGVDFFGAMAGCFVRVSPPLTPVLSEYGGNFADFVANFEPARELPYLADVARLEYAIGRAYHAADADPLSLESMQALANVRLDDARISVHPSLQLVASKFPIVSIWRAHLPEAEATAIDLKRPEDAIVARPRLEVEAHVLPVGGFAFVRALGNGETFSAASSLASRVAPDFDLTDCFRVLLRSGAIAALHVEDNQHVHSQGLEAS